MNKFGFLSCLLTFCLFFLEFIPLGIQIGASGATSSWLLNIFGVSTDPWIRAYAQFPLEFYNDGHVKLFIWGIISNGTLHLWLENPTPTKSHGLWWASLLFLYIIHHVRRTDLCE